MLKSRIAALAGALALAALATSAAARGGGYVIVYMAPSGPPPPLFQGREASMALEVTDAAPMVTEGDAKPGDVVAIQPVRAEAIVLTAPAKGRRDLPAGTVLVRARFVSPDERAVVWCDIRPSGGLGFSIGSFTHDCFQDTKGSGQLDELWAADYRAGGFLGFGTSGVDDRSGPIAAPATYRAARPDEAPAAFIGYKYCDGDDVVSPSRFRLAIGTDADPTRWKLVGDCRAGLWSDPADKSKVDVDGLHMIVTPAGAGTIHFKLVDRLAPGPVGPLVRYAPLRNTPIAPAAREAALKSALVLAGDPPRTSTGEVGVGQAILTASVKHGLTGHLLVRVFPRFGIIWPKGTEMDVGQAVFGVPSEAGPGDGIAWCAATRKPTAWETACINPVSDSYMQMTATNLGYYWQAKQKPALAPNRASLGGGGTGDPASTDPAVALGPIDGDPPMTVSVSLAAVRPKSKSDATLVYDIDVNLDWGEGPQRLNRVNYALPAEGKAIRVLGQVLLLQPGADTAHMAVTAPAPPPSEPADLDLLATK